MLDIAIIGAGKIGEIHIKNLLTFQCIKLIGFVEPNKTRRDYISKLYNLKAFTSLDELLKSRKPSAIIIASPITRHFHLLEQVIRANVPLFVEKPITDCFKKAQYLLKLIEEFNAFVMVGYVERFNPVTQVLRKLILEKKIGKIFEINTCRTSSFPTKTLDTGVTLEVAVHDLDLIINLLNMKPQKYTALFKNYLNKKFEDSVKITMFFENNLVCTTKANWISTERIAYFELIGELGEIKADFLLQKVIVNLKTDSGFVSEYILPIRDNPMHIQHRHFFEALKLHKQSHLNAAESWTSLEIALNLLNELKS